MGEGSGRVFGYAELTINGNEPYRIDALITEQVSSAISEDARETEAAIERERWFKGTVEGSFEGTVLEVDLRGALPQVKLILSAGGQEIDCIVRGMDREEIRAILDRRVILSGRALYDGTGGLPRRIEVHSAETLRVGVAFNKWGGHFARFEALDWDDSE
jgi:hypothetical protein